MGVNNLEYVKLLLHSLKTNLDNKNHEILIFVDADNEHSVEYLKSIKADFHDLSIIYNTLPIPIGYQRNKTLLTEYAKYDVISYLQSDMVIGPHYDTEILKNVKKGRILSSTRVEPPLHGSSPITVTKNFGLHPTKFDMETWNIFSNSIKKNELVSYFFAPFTYYKEDWLRLGGYDTVFRRSREDSDFVQRCLHVGIELIQTFSANVYHFTCVTSRGNDWFNENNKTARERVLLQQTADTIELKRFIRKWGSFNHGETKLFKLDMDLVVNNYTNLEIIEQIEPFFSRVWLRTENDKNNLISKYHQYQSIANTLLYSNDGVWETYKHLYTTENFENIFRVGEPTDFDIKVVIDFNNINENNSFLNNIHDLYELLKDCEVGVYELDGVQVHVNKVKKLPTVITANNPKFDYSLIEKL